MLPHWNTLGIKIQSLNEMACVGLITFSEMGSSHSLHYVLHSEDDSLTLCMRLCVVSVSHLLPSSVHFVCCASVKMMRAACPSIDACARLCQMFLCSTHVALSMSLYKALLLCLRMSHRSVSVCVHACVRLINPVTQRVHQTLIPEPFLWIGR